MTFINFEELSLPIIYVIFIGASAGVWFAGIRLSRYADAIAKKTGTADVVLGTLLLWGVTSLPEVVTTITASSMGDAPLSINNLFGGVALQVTILAFGDMIIRKQSIILNRKPSSTAAGYNRFNSHFDDLRRWFLSYQLFSINPLVQIRS